MEAGFLHIDQLASQGQDRLRAAVAALFGRATCGVTFDNVQLRLRRIALRTIGQFPRQAAAGERGFPHRFTRLAGRLAGTGGVYRLLDDFPRQAGSLFEKGHQPFVDDRGDHALDFGIDEFRFGLRVEAGIRHFHRDHADESLAHIIAGKRGVLVLENLVGLGKLIDRPCQRGAETC